VLSALGMQPWAYAVYAIAAAALIIVLHWGNIQRIIAGTEPRFGKGGSRREGAQA